MRWRRRPARAEYTNQEGYNNTNKGKAEELKELSCNRVARRNATTNLRTDDEDNNKKKKPFCGKKSHGLNL